MTPPLLARRRLLGAVGAVIGAGVVGGGGIVGGALGCATSPDARRADDGDGDGDGAPGGHPLAGITDFDGVALESLPPLVGSKATVVDFWASWCGPCRTGFRHLDQLYRTWLGRGLDMIAISVDDDPVAARRFAASFRPRFPLAWDANADVRERFAVVTLPTTLLFDADGQLLMRNVGFDLAEHRAMQERVRQLVETT
jgi:thiol-disulfide isomerase/thioredoxin